MPIRSSSLDTVQLALATMQRIPRIRYISAGELRAQLKDAGIDRSVRTLQRTLKFLVEHFDIECRDDSKPYGYRWKENASGILIPSLGRNEALMLSLAERFLQNLVPAGTMPSLETVLARARERIGKDELQAQWLAKVRYAYPTPLLVPPAIKQETLDTVTECLYGNLKMRVGYTNRLGETKELVVLPLGLVSRAQVLYLIVMFEDGETPYRLALHRMNSVEATTIEFAPPTDFDIDECIATYGFSPGDQTPVKLEFFIDAGPGQHLTESRLSNDQTCEFVGGEYRVSATVRDSIELRHWLRGFGDDIRSVLLDGRPLITSELDRWLSDEHERLAEPAE